MQFKKACPPFECNCFQLKNKVIPCLQGLLFSRQNDKVKKNSPKLLNTIIFDVNNADFVFESLLGEAVILQKLRPSAPPRQQQTRSYIHIYIYTYIYMYICTYTEDGYRHRCHARSSRLGQSALFDEIKCLRGVCTQNAGLGTSCQ